MNQKEGKYKEQELLNRLIKKVSELTSDKIEVSATALAENLAKSGKFLAEKIEFESYNVRDQVVSIRAGDIAPVEYPENQSIESILENFTNNNGLIISIDPVMQSEIVTSLKEVSRSSESFPFGHIPLIAELRESNKELRVSLFADVDLRLDTLVYDSSENVWNSSWDGEQYSLDNKVTGLQEIYSNIKDSMNLESEKKVDLSPLDDVSRKKFSIGTIKELSSNIGNHENKPAKIKEQSI